MLKSERREIKRRKKREQMDKGKKLKLLEGLTLARAIRAGLVVGKEKKNV